MGLERKGEQTGAMEYRAWVLWAIGLRFPLQLENSPFLPNHVGLEAV